MRAGWGEIQREGGREEERERAVTCREERDERHNRRELSSCEEAAERERETS